jgi:hypothetical protein
MTVDDLVKQVAFHVAAQTAATDRLSSSSARGALPG